MNSANFYHIYNRANGNEKLFLAADNYFHFLRQFKKYISPIAEVYAYCLIPNHFHFVIRIKSEEELTYFFKDKLSKGFKPLESLISLQFSHFFNSYSQAFNKKYKRKGSLFAPNFKKKIITDKVYLQQVILYVHLNPVKHKMERNFFAYPYSSYSSILSNKPTLINREAVIALFEDAENYKFVHQEQKIKTVLIAEIVRADD